MLGRTLWTGAVIFIVMLFDARTAFAVELLAAGAVMVAVWLPWFVAAVWMAKSSIAKSAKALACARLSAGDKARLIAGYSGL
jgi:hypothetical protein